MKPDDPPVPEGFDRDIEEEITAWTAECPQCGEARLTILTKAGEAGPWAEIIGGATEVDREDYYCHECGRFVNLKDASNWVQAVDPS